MIGYRGLRRLANVRGQGIKSGLHCWVVPWLVDDQSNRRTWSGRRTEYPPFERIAFVCADLPDGSDAASIVETGEVT